MVKVHMGITMLRDSAIVIKHRKRRMTEDRLARADHIDRAAHLTSEKYWGVFHWLGEQQ